MYEKFVAERIAALRIQKNVSAREMSLSIGQNESYINRIENGHTLPSMQCFFYICEYLGVTPTEFFDIHNTHPVFYKKAMDELMALDEKQLDFLLAFIKNLKTIKELT